MKSDKLDIVFDGRDAFSVEPAKPMTEKFVVVATAASGGGGGGNGGGK